MTSIKTKGSSKYKEGRMAIKESNTLSNKHREMVKQFNNSKTEKELLNDELEKINNDIEKINLDVSSNDIIKQKAFLLDKKDDLLNKYKSVCNNYNEMDYYDNVGDLISTYYNIVNVKEFNVKETKNILDFLCDKKDKQPIVENDKILNKTKIFEKYCQRVDGIRIKHDDGSDRIKYCVEDNVEKILDTAESSYICPICGDSETIILDEGRQIKDYSPYRRLNHFREWLNQFQAKQSPEINEQVFFDIVKELNKNRVTDLSILTKKNTKTMLKKLGYNNYYEHVAYIINALNNLPPPKITRDMEKVFISMFIQIQEPWELYKQPNRKNFLSYSYVLHKFCELLELDHLLECFPLHKDFDKIMENDNIWEKICKHLNWEYIPSFK